MQKRQSTFKVAFAEESEAVTKNELYWVITKFLIRKYEEHIDLLRKKAHLREYSRHFEKLPVYKSLSPIAVKFVSTTTL